jgi:soluble lytic murein transglycosylase-like protein
LPSTDRTFTINAVRSFGMTWQHFLRTLAIAILGAAALTVASQARAEGGNGGAFISPDQAEEFLKAAAEAEKAFAEEVASESSEAKETEKTAKGVDKKVKEAVAGVAATKTRQTQTEASKVQDASQAAVQPENDAAEEQTAAVSEPRIDGKAKSRLSDAVRASALKPLIARYASENDLPYELADAVIRIESRYNAGARNGPNMGLTQINFRTAQSLGYEGAAAGLLDAETNLRYGLKYLAKAYKLAGGDTCGTILRYQFGHRTQTMTGASRAYCAKVKVITAAAE